MARVRCIPGANEFISGIDISSKASAVLASCTTHDQFVVARKYCQLAINRLARMREYDLAYWLKLREAKEDYAWQTGEKSGKTLYF